MGYGAVSYEPFTSLQAHLRIIEVEEVDGQFEDTPKQVKCTFKVLNYEESEDDNGENVGWTFIDWFGFSLDKKTGAIGISKSPKSKLRSLIKNALYPDGEKIIERGEFEPSMLMNQEIRARVARSGKNEDGDHSRIKADTIMPKPRHPAAVKAVKEVEEEVEKDLDMNEAPF